MPKYVSGFNGPLNPIINITFYLGLGGETNFKGKRISLCPIFETKKASDHSWSPHSKVKTNKSVIITKQIVTKLLALLPKIIF